MKKLILIALLIGITFSCEDFNEWNVDGKNPSSVPASFLVTSSQKDLFTRMASTSVNYNIFKLFAQYWTQTQYIDESNYDIRGRDIGGGLSTFLYRDVLMDLNEAKIIILADEFITDGDKATQLAVIELLSVYTWTVLVDTYGYVPYTEALQGLDNLIPVYDSGASIYTDLFSRIDVALGQLNQDGDAFGSSDLMYSGSTDQWKKFGNSLKLKMAVRTADFDAGRAATMASQAVAGGVFESSSDNAAFPFESAPPNTNPVWVSLVQSGRNDFVIAKTFIDIIQPLNDPRRFPYMDQNLQEDIGTVSEINDDNEIIFSSAITSSPSVGDHAFIVDGDLIGTITEVTATYIKIGEYITTPAVNDKLSYGVFTGATYGSGSSYNAFTHIGESWHTPDFESIILSHDEVQFLLAEAVERNLITGDAETYYNAGISSSIMYWGGSQGDADTYLAQATVAYGTAGSTWKEIIGNQKYIALYGRGFEAWSSWRLLDFPSNFNRPEISEEAVPRRYLYGNDDPNLNEANYDAASSAMGGDSKDSRVFWDINGQGN